MKKELFSTHTRQDYAKTSTLWEDTKSKDKPCIWMQAGVTAKKYCNNFYDCNNCKYDTAMEKKMQLTANSSPGRMPCGCAAAVREPAAMP